jgi:class 3 adenylate cyclase
VSGGRVQQATAAFLRQEFGASAAAISGFVDILIEDARRADLTDVMPDLERIRAAAALLSEQIAEALDAPAGTAADVALLQHNLRTPLNAIKGYGELLVEVAQDSGNAAPLADLGRVLTLAARLLGEIDGIGNVMAEPRIDAVDTLLRTIRPLGEAGLASDPNAATGHILVVDDNASNRDLLIRRLSRKGYRVTTAEDGASAIAFATNHRPDLVLLDLMMPGISGFEVLRRLKADAGTRHVPVIMMSALDELDSTVRCIEAGAEDYLPKPFNPVLLHARIGASLGKKRLLDELQAEKERSEALPRNILPSSVIERMRQGRIVIADKIPEATVLFSDLADFTSISARLAPEETVALLGMLFSKFDELAAHYRLETIKTIGDGYMVTAGVLEQQPEGVVAVAEMALAMLDAAKAVDNEELQLRIGIHTGGPIIAGVLDTHKIAYDVWGDAVNTAKRMESYGLPGKIHVSSATRLALRDAFRFEPRGFLEIKGKGAMETYFLYRR